MLIYDAHAPGFVRTSDNLTIKLMSSKLGPTNHDNHFETLQVKTSVLCESGYCEKIMPLMTELNRVDSSFLTRQESHVTHHVVILSLDVDHRALITKTN